MSKQKTIKDLSKAMDKLLRKVDRTVQGESGCCKISYMGSTIERSGFTRNECKDLADDYPEANWQFTSGSCR